MKISETYIPPTLEDAISYLVSCCDEEDAEMIRTKGESIAVEMFGHDGKPFKLNTYPYIMHHGYGQMIRNAWGLWNGSILQDHFKQRFGLGHADDMSGLIMDGVEAHFQGKPYGARQINQRVKRSKNHWEKIGIDPLTQQEIKCQNQYSSTKITNLSTTMGKPIQEKSLVQRLLAWVKTKGS